MLPEPSPVDPSIDAERPTLESSARRRVLRGGLAAGPVVLTIASRPVLGQVACVAPSAMGWMPTSGTHPALTCSGLTPVQWSAIATQWPSPYVGQGAATSAPATTTTTAAPTPPVTTTTTTTYSF